MSTVKEKLKRPAHFTAPGSSQRAFVTHLYLAHIPVLALPHRPILIFDPINDDLLLRILFQLIPAGSNPDENVS
ncbi:MAG: hypothetical protein ABR501_11985 [Pyrinomonadaceae bacterium]